MQLRGVAFSFVRCKKAEIIFLHSLPSHRELHE